MCLFDTIIVYIIFMSCSNMCLMFQDKLLSKLEENEPEIATSQEDEVCKYFYTV